MFCFTCDLEAMQVHSTAPADYENVLFVNENIPEECVL